jgi:alpha-tubulin suppressor-like RCC1 family protein
MHVGISQHYLLMMMMIGTAFTFGRNDCGQLGLGDTSSRGVPYSTNYKESALWGRAVMWVAAGPLTTGVITEDDHVYMWGKASDGALGVGVVTATDEQYRATPGNCNLMPITYHDHNITYILAIDDNQ